jgi:bifunctional non-homologous end joining protein LigD
MLESQLAELARDTSPFDKVPKLPRPHWVDPELVVEVQFQNWTGAGIMRAPRYRGLRDDKDPAEVVREIR